MTKFKTRVLIGGIGSGVVILGAVFALYWWLTIQLGSIVPEPWVLRKMRFGWAARRSQPLVNAIEAYTKAQGRPPSSLAELVPKYLGRVPQTGLWDFPDFGYRAFTNAGYHEFWWDMGSHEGQGPIGTHPEGPLARAILVVTFDRDFGGVYAETDRMPTNFVEFPFDEGRWKRKDGRIKIVKSLLANQNFKGQTTNAVFGLLGPPDGATELRQVPWELRIKCPSYHGLDSFVYWPGGNYPEYGWGGATEKVGNWVYVHE